MAGAADIDEASGLIKSPGWEQVRALSDVIGGTTPGRNSENDITLFESQGVALEDIALAARVYQIALDQNVGVSF